MAAKIWEKATSFGVEGGADSEMYMDVIVDLENREEIDDVKGIDV